MDYYIFRIKPTFKGLIDEDILKTILEQEKNKFYGQQLKEIIEIIPWETMVEVAKKYFKERNDIRINDFSFIWQSLFSGKRDELWALHNCLRLHQEEESSPFRTFLEEFNEDWVYVPCEEIMNI